MKELTPKYQGYFLFHQAVLNAQGICLELEEVSGDLIWIRVQTSATLREVVSKAEVRHLVLEVLRLLPY